ncbi:hypothetical protein [Pseudomonas farsensis]|uniref:Uncharacterized protein n=1 Tax=Pseudomonas farsensis TaxID=2745492 RepID=A0ABU8QQZ7_9PSED
MIYDRARTNQLLAQEFVENLTSTDYFPPFSSVEETDSQNKTVMNNFKFDAPVLSFTNSNISRSRARLSMKITHGQYISFNKPLGSTDHSVVSIATVNALNAPSLHMDIDLHATSNGNIVDGEGQVLLDLSDGENHTFGLSSSGDRNRVLGLAIEKHFNSWSDESKRFVLSRIVTGDSGLRPTSFAIRTHSLARSGEKPEEDNTGEGAVIIGVAMNNEPNGNFPVQDSDLPYLLPDDAPTPIRMNILLSNRIWFSELLKKALAYFDKYTDIKYSLHKNSRGFLDGIDLNHAQSSYLGTTYDVNPPRSIFLPVGGAWDGYIEYQLRQIFIRPQPFDFSGIKVRFNGRQMTVSWSGEHPVPAVTFLKLVGQTGRDLYGNSHLTFKFNLESVYDLHIAPTGADIGKLVFGETSTTRSFDLTGQWYWNAPDGQDYLRNWLAESWSVPFRAYCQTLTDTSRNIDALMLDNLLFRSDMRGVPRLIEAPGDMTLLGHLAPDKLHFALHPATSVVSASSSLQFLLESAPAGVTWSIELLPGEFGEKGSISVNGLYQAPSPGAVPEQGRRVKVIARKDQYVSQALLYLVRNDVSVYPSLQVAQHSHTRYLLVAGSGDGKLLKWGVTPTSLGSVRAVTELDHEDMDIPDAQDVQIYVSPPVPRPLPTDWRAAVHLDQITVTGASGRTQMIDMLVLWSNPVCWFETEYVAQGVRLRMWLAGRSGPIEIFPDEADWYLVKGAGELKDGVYKSTGSEQGYAIIVAIEKSERFLNYAYIVLPFPLIDLKTLKLVDQTSTD